MQSFVFPITYLFLMILSVFAENLVSKTLRHLTNKGLRKHYQSWGRYVMPLLFPMIITAFVIYLQGYSLLYYFLIFSVLGGFMEWIAGYLYNLISTKQLWTYHYLTVGKKGYTSWIIIPIWGCAGIFFAYFGQALFATLSAH